MASATVKTETCDISQDTNMMEATQILYNNLPPEIWERIFCELAPIDFLSVINSCENWRQLVKPYATSALLPLVLPIFLQQIKFNLHSFLGWRAVTSRTKSVMDKMLALHFTSSENFYKIQNQMNSSYISTRPTENQDTTLQFLNKIGPRFEFTKAKEITKFLTHFKSHSIFTPFLTKFITLNSTGNANLAEHELRKMQKKLLSLFGHQITTLNFSIHGKVLGSGVRHFLDMLNHLPNLKILIINGKLEDEGGMWNDCEETRLREMKWPLLNNLEMLDIEEFVDTKEARLSFNRFIFQRYGTQLNGLVCGANLFRIVDRIVLSSRVPNMKRLAIETLDSHCFSVLSQVNWPLEELAFYSPIYCNVKLEEFGNTLNKFSSTLKHLHLLVPLNKSLTHFPSEPFSGDFRKVLPKLVKLSTDYGNVLTNSFWHLVEKKFKNLEELTVISGDIIRNINHVAKRGFELLPNLQKVNFRCAQFREKCITRSSLWNRNMH